LEDHPIYAAGRLGSIKKERSKLRGFSATINPSSGLFQSSAVYCDDAQNPIGGGSGNYQVTAHSRVLGHKHYEMA
ncbi:MAG: hypothetical protein ACPF9D_09965, partial [Owenweeksia sp.]